MDLIRKVCPIYDAEEICKIRLPSRKTSDFIACNHEDLGLFSVRSAYKLAEEIKNRDRPVASSSASEMSNSSIWDLIWKCKIPQKNKILNWRVATGSLATTRNKKRRTIEVNATCPIFGQEDEND